jgi:hypothetical protein
MTPARDDWDRTFSVVVEMENAVTICWSDVGRTLCLLADQIAQRADTGPRRPQVLLVHPGSESESAQLRVAACAAAPRLEKVARLEVLSVPQGRYYELKNAGIARADGQVVVLLDSDTLPEPGWLDTLLAPFDRPEVVVVSGQTYLEHNDFVSRMMALIWLFPLRAHDEQAVRRRALNANNCALRVREVGREPFPIDNGFKVACTKFMRRLEARGIELVRVPALAAHAPLRGWRFLLWRALVTGRDADRKFADLKSPARGRRLLAAAGFALRMGSRAVRRVLAQYRHVAMPWYQVPLAASLGAAFYLLAGCSQTLRALGLTPERPESIPAYAEHH